MQLDIRTMISAMDYLENWNISALFIFQNFSGNFTEGATEDLETGPQRGSLEMVLTMTVVYAVLFATGVVGNTGTCIVIARNRYMHTATNYYLFSLAVSDILLLVMGLPQEMYLLWIPSPYVFGEVLCFLRGYTAETSTNASILTITAFTVERYVAICHPLKAHTMSRLSRAIKTVVAVWVLAAACAVPVAYQFGIIYNETETGQVMLHTAMCSVKRPSSLAFTMSFVVFFLVPLVVISVLYVKIGLRLQASALMVKHNGLVESNKRESYQFNNSRRTIVKMLVAVVVSFFLCWSPFQAQRLMAIYMDEKHSNLTRIIFSILHYISGVTYYLSATINPILYQLMSFKFQQAFKDTFGTMSRCLKGEQDDLVAMDNNVTEHSGITQSTCRRKSQSISKIRLKNSSSEFYEMPERRSSLPCIYDVSRSVKTVDNML